MPHQIYDGARCFDWCRHLCRYLLLKSVMFKRPTGLRTVSMRGGFCCGDYSTAGIRLQAHFVKQFCNGADFGRRKAYFLNF